MRGLGIIILALLVEKLMCVCIFFAGPSDVLKSPFSFVLFFSSSEGYYSNSSFSCYVL